MSLIKEPEQKKLKTDIKDDVLLPKTCKFFLLRKKRLCKMTVGKDKEYCGEHEVILYKNETTNVVDPGAKRIPCPLDPKHSIDTRKLEKHIKVCNARPKEQPQFLKTGINIESDADGQNSSVTELKLSQIDEALINRVIEKTKSLYDKYVAGNIDELILEHEILKEEIQCEKYGPASLKHLIQSSSILGCMQHMNFLQPNTCFIEFGAGKGQVSYWLAKAISNLLDTQVLLIDKASHRHKMDNKIDEDSVQVQRIRADISDLDLSALDKPSKSRIIGVSKHLCGAATDLTLRCITNGNKKATESDSGQTEGFAIAVCCHHRCTWQSFVGKAFLAANNVSREEFEVMTKTVGWAICGTGMSRERRKQLSERTESEREPELTAGTESSIKLDRVEKEKIGTYCKRIFDYARLKYLEEHNFKCSLKYYVKNDITLENVVLIGEKVV